MKTNKRRKYSVPDSRIGTKWEPVWGLSFPSAVMEMRAQLEHAVATTSTCRRQRDLAQA